MSKWDFHHHPSYGCSFSVKGPSLFPLLTILSTWDSENERHRKRKRGSNIRVSTCNTFEELKEQLRYRMCVFFRHTSRHHILVITIISLSLSFGSLGLFIRRKVSCSCSNCLFRRHIVSFSFCAVFSSRLCHCEMMCTQLSLRVDYEMSSLALTREQRNSLFVWLSSSLSPFDCDWLSLCHNRASP